jgi:hypothetical protein
MFKGIGHRGAAIQQSVPDGDITAGVGECTVAERLGDVSRGLADYLSRRERLREIAPSQMHTDLSPAEAFGDRLLAQSVRAYRDRANEFSRCAQMTDTVVACWLAAHRVGLAQFDQMTGDASADNDPLTHDAGNLGADPLLLLISHIQDTLEVVTGSPRSDEVLTRFEATLTKPMNTLRTEITAATSYHAASIAFARAATKAALT